MDHDAPGLVYITNSKDISSGRPSTPNRVILDHQCHAPLSRPFTSPSQPKTPSLNTPPI